MNKFVEWKEILQSIPRSIKVWIILTLQVLFLFYLVSGHYYVLWAGEDVRLKTVPIDPTDLFYGDYVILNYEISTVRDPKRQFDYDSRGEPVYVTLQQTGDTYDAVAISREKPKLQSGQKVIKGQVMYVNDVVVRVRYGLERYYVEENTGLEIERLVRNARDTDNVHVVIKLLPSGKAVVDHLEYQGKKL
jgi:uncharacterized membrane-anchored protein